MGEGKGEPCIQSRSPIPCQLQMSRVWECTGGAVWLYVCYSSFKSCPFEAHNLNSRARERTWVQTSSERLSLPWVCTKLSLCWSQPCGAWRLLPVTAVLKTFLGVCEIEAKFLAPGWREALMQRSTRSALVMPWHAVTFQSCLGVPKCLTPEPD